MRVVAPKGALAYGVWLGTLTDPSGTGLRIDPMGPPLTGLAPQGPVHWSLPASWFSNGLSAQALFLFEERVEWSKPFTLP